MNINLSLSPHEQIELEQRAAAVGTDVSIFIQNLLRDQLNELNGSSAAEMSYEQWQKDFRSWIANQRSRNPRFDDSRESVYR